MSGHNGMVGASLCKKLISKGFNNLIVASRDELDLRNQNDVSKFLKKKKPEIVINLAAKVGGINSNISKPAEYIYDNIIMNTNLIHESYINKVERFVNLGSSCIFPKECQQPMKERFLLTGPLEPTNEGYALAKICGIKMLESYKKQYGFNSISIIPPNLYGPGDDFDLENCHVLSALVKRFVDSNANNNITLWGTGIAKREFLHVYDLCLAIYFILKNNIDLEYDLINIGTGKEISIKELANNISSYTNFKGKISWDSSKPDGMLKKCLDIEEMKKIGFTPKTKLKDGIKEMINQYKKS